MSTRRPAWAAHFRRAPLYKSSSFRAPPQELLYKSSSLRAPASRAAGWSASACPSSCRPAASPHPPHRRPRPRLPPPSPRPPRRRPYPRRPPLASPPDWRSLCPCKCTEGCARVTLGLLVDLSAGFVTFRLNGVNGPRVPLGEGWQDGVEVRLDGSWPDPEVDSWQAAIEQPLCVPAGLYASPLLGPEWEPEEHSQDENSDGGNN